jgi:hypothetical protein
MGLCYMVTIGLRGFRNTVGLTRGCEPASKACSSRQTESSIILHSPDCPLYIFPFVSKTKVLISIPSTEQPPYIQLLAHTTSSRQRRFQFCRRRCLRRRSILDLLLLRSRVACSRAGTNHIRKRAAGMTRASGLVVRRGIVEDFRLPQHTELLSVRRVVRLSEAVEADFPCCDAQD